MSHSRRRKAEREAARRRQQQLIVLGGLVATAIIVVVLILIANVPPEASVAALDEDFYAGLERRINEEGLPELGAADAPVEIAEYSSFSCSHCRTFHNNQFVQLVNNEVRNGTVKIVFVPVTDSYTVSATSGALCAAEQGMFWELHDVLFDWQGLYGISGYSTQRVRAGAETLGLDMGAFDACVGSSEVAERLDVYNAAFRALEGQYPDVFARSFGTPTLTFNGVPAEWGSGAAGIEDIRAVIAQVGG